MPENEAAVRSCDIDCCPVLEKKSACDTLDFRYLLPYRTVVGENRQQVNVEVILHFQFERCSGPLTLGDLLYTTTLFPGEDVRLFTSDRHSRWSYDSESSMTYRHETTSEESFFMQSVAKSMSDLEIAESIDEEESSRETSVSGGGGFRVNFGIVRFGGGGGASRYTSESVREFSRNLTQHARSSSSAAAAGVRSASSTSVGEVERREHAEGESESTFESSSRRFSNPNRCHAITYFFYKINKTQHLRFRLVGIERHVDDPAAPVTAEMRKGLDRSGGVEIRRDFVPAASKSRLDIERMARTSMLERRQAAIEEQRASHLTAGRMESARRQQEPAPIDPKTRHAALQQVDRELANEGLRDPETGKPSERIIAELSWERTEVLPTPGILIRGCLDTCNTCEPALQRQVELELERMKLENEKLKRETELLHKSKEYRSSPNDDEEADQEQDDAL